MGVFLTAHGPGRLKRHTFMLVAQFKSFFMVARLGSITLAAKQLGFSQPTVTSQIRVL